MSKGKSSLCGFPGCDLLGKKRCSQCKSIEYCTADHQRKHWGLHRKECKPKAKQKAGSGPASVKEDVETTWVFNPANPNAFDAGTLYWHPLSMHSNLVRFFLQAAGIKHKLERVDHDKYETPEHLVVNPRGQIPVIKKNDFAFWESGALIRANAIISRSWLYPREVAANSKVESAWESIKNSFWDSSNRHITLRFIGPIILKAKRQPKESKKVLKLMQGQLAWVDRTFFEDHPFHVVLDHITIADCILGEAIFHLLLWFPDFKMKTFPKVAKWYEKLQTLEVWASVHKESMISATKIGALGAERNSSFPPGNWNGISGLQPERSCRSPTSQSLALQRPTLHWFASSSNANASRSLLMASNIDHDINIVDLGAGKQKEPEYLAINPKGTVPAISFPNSPICTFESGAIMRVTQLLKETSLYPRNDYRALASVECAFEMVKHGAWRHVIGMIFYQYQAPAMMKWKVDGSKVESARAALHQELHVFEHHFLSKAFLVTEQLSVADIQLAECLFLLQLWFKEDELQQYPKIKAWFKRVSEFPFWADAHRASVAAAHEVGATGWAEMLLSMPSKQPVSGVWVEREGANEGDALRAALEERDAARRAVETAEAQQRQMAEALKELALDKRVAELANSKLQQMYTEARVAQAEALLQVRASSMAPLTMSAGVPVEQQAAAILEQLREGKLSVANLLGPLSGGGKGARGPAVQSPTAGKERMPFAPAVPFAPMDEHNTLLVQNVSKPSHANAAPPAAHAYDLVVVGAGVAGLLSVIMGHALGKRCALIERHALGGDCLNVGCFPSKVLVACARELHRVRHAGRFGVMLPKDWEPHVDFSAVMERVRRLRASISHHDSVDRYARDFCQDVFLGQASFLGGNRISVKSESHGDVTVTFKNAMIATGASPAIPPCAGLQEVTHLTSNNLFNLTELPPRMVVMGAGPIGMEISQALQRFGTQCTVLEAGKQVLGREDAEAAECVQQAMQRDGVVFLTGARAQKVRLKSAGNHTKAPWAVYETTVKLASGETQVLESEAVFNATGRVPNVFGMGLEDAQVQFDSKKGVLVDACFRTSNPDIYACGDVASMFKFTHAADFQARLAVRNMFLGDQAKERDLLVPWCTYTDPEVSRVGLNEKEIEAAGIQHETWTRNLADVDRCKCDGLESGFVKISVRKETDQILGATIVGPNAGDMISEITVCMQNGVGCGQLAGTMHPYPTMQEAVRQCAARYNKNYRSPAVNLVLNKLMEEHEMAKQRAKEAVKYGSE